MQFNMSHRCLGISLDTSHLTFTTALKIICRTILKQIVHVFFVRQEKQILLRALENLDDCVGEFRTPTFWNGLSFINQFENIFFV